MYRSRRRWRWGVRGGLTVAVIAIAVAGIALLGRHAGGREADALAREVEERGVGAADLAADLARTHRIVLLGDIAGSPATQRLAVRVTESLAAGPGLDAVALEVGSDLQPMIDRYLGTVPEDVGILLASPRALAPQWGTQQAFLELYRAVWRINASRDAARRIRIVAIDRPDWPPRDALSLEASARRFASRDEHMAATLDDVILSRTPRARVLVVVGGYHALRGGRGELRIGGGERIAMRWLGARLVTEYGREVATLLPDAATRPGAVARVAAYGGTRLHPLIEARLGRRGTLAVPVTRAFAFMPDPIATRASAGLELEILPRGYVLDDVADGYIYLGGGG